MCFWCLDFGIVVSLVKLNDLNILFCCCVSVGYDNKGVFI